MGHLVGITLRTSDASRHAVALRLACASPVASSTLGLLVRENPRDNATVDSAEPRRLVRGSAARLTPVTCVSGSCRQSVNVGLGRTSAVVKMGWPCQRISARLAALVRPVTVQAASTPSVARTVAARHIQMEAAVTSSWVSPTCLRNRSRMAWALAAAAAFASRGSSSAPCGAGRSADHRRTLPPGRRTE